MNMNRIIQMIINQLLRRVVNGGVTAAINQFSRMAGPNKAGSSQLSSTSARGQEQTQAAAREAKRARKAARLLRKL